MLSLFRRRRQNPLGMLGLSDAASLCSHLFLMGGSGSGKTSILRILMSEIINRGVGCLWLCVKNDEAQNAIGVINSTTMRDRLIHLAPGQENCRFNFLAWELQKGSPTTAARLLERLNQQLMRSNGDREEQFWANLFFRYLKNSIVICWFAFREKANIEHVYQLITSTPNSIEHSKSEMFYSSHCYQMINSAEGNLQSESERREFEMAVTFLLKETMQLGDKARTAGVTQSTAILTPFLTSPIYETTCNDSTFTPDMALDGHCVVLDAPVLTHKTSGMLFQSLVTMLTIEEALRRPDPQCTTAIVRDEVQMLIADPAFEAMAMSVARSHKLAFVSATQSIPTLHAMLGGTAEAEVQMHSQLGNYNTQLILANRCSVTNNHYSQAFGNQREQFIGVSETPPKEHLDMMSLVFGSDDYLYSTNEQMVPRVEPSRFLELRRGGTAHRFLIDAFFTQGGRTYDGCPYKLVTFSQK